MLTHRELIRQGVMNEAFDTSLFTFHISLFINHIFYLQTGSCSQLKDNRGKIFLFQTRAKRLLYAISC